MSRYKGQLRGGGMKFLGLLVVIVLIGVAFHIVDRNYGYYSEIYECFGTMIRKSGRQTPITLFARMTKYRWWRVTGDVAGALRLEIPVGSTVAPGTDPFAFKREGSYLNLHPWPKAGETVDLASSQKGQFSTISDTLVLNISDDEQFQGRCKLKNT
jgi:hypothetical protein